MNVAAASPRAAAATATAAAALGFAWHDSLLVALACVIGFRLLVGQVERQARQAALRAGLNCIAIGLLGIAAATALVVVTIGALMGWWVVEHPQPGIALAVPIVAGALLAGARVDRSGAWREARTWVVLVAATAVALQLADAGFLSMPCVLVAGIGVHLAWNSWGLAHGVSEGVLRSGEPS